MTYPIRGRRRHPLRILISSGPTREPIDPVRFLSNYSTGYLGAQLAAEGLARGHRVTVVSGPSTEPLPSGARVIPVEQAQQMERALRRHGQRADVLIMAAAVSDFRPAHPRSVKLSRRRHLSLRLTVNPDIIARLPRRPKQLVAGFALETQQVLARARRKLREKRLDLLVAQDASRTAPFGRRKIRAWLLVRGGEVTRLSEFSKARVARVLLDKIESLWYGQVAEWSLHNGKFPCSSKPGRDSPSLNC